MFQNKCIAAVLVTSFFSVTCFGGPNDLPDDPTKFNTAINDENFGDVLKNVDEKLAYLQSAKEGFQNAEAIHLTIENYFKNKTGNPAQVKQAVLIALRMIDYDSRIGPGNGRPSIRMSYIQRISSEAYRPGVAEFANGQESWKGFKDVMQFADSIKLSEITLSISRGGEGPKEAINSQIDGWRARFHALTLKAMGFPEDKKKAAFEKFACSNACCILGLNIK